MNEWVELRTQNSGFQKITQKTLKSLQMKTTYILFNPSPTETPPRAKRHWPYLMPNQDTDSGQDKLLVRSSQLITGLWFSPLTQVHSTYPLTQLIQHLLPALFHRTSHRKTQSRKRTTRTHMRMGLGWGMRVAAEKSSEWSKDLGSGPGPLQDPAPPEAQLMRFKPAPADGSNSSTFLPKPHLSTQQLLSGVWAGKRFIPSLHDLMIMTER